MPTTLKEVYMMSSQDKPTQKRRQRKRPQDWRYKRHREEDERGLPREDYSHILGYPQRDRREEEE